MSRNEIKQNTRYLGWVFKRNRWLLLAVTLVGILLVYLYRSWNLFSIQDNYFYSENALELFQWTKYILFVVVLITVFFNFRYLFSKQENDFFLSSPIKRSVTFLSKLLVIITAALINTVIFALLILSKSETNSEAINIFVLNFFNVFFASFCAAAIFSFFAVIETRALNFIYMSLFTVIGVPYAVALCVSSFVYIFSAAFIKTQYFLLAFPYVTFDSSLLTDCKFMILSTAVYALLCIVFVVLGLWSFNKRKSEQTQNTKPNPISSAILMTFSVLLIFGSCMFLYSQSLKGLIFACIVTVLFVCIYAFAVLKKKSAKNIGAVIAALTLICVSSFAVFKVTDSYSQKFIRNIIPAEEIESFEISEIGYNNHDTVDLYQNGRIIVKNTAQITDRKAIDLLCNYQSKVFDSINSPYLRFSIKEKAFLVTYHMKDSSTRKRLVTNSFYGSVDPKKYQQAIDLLSQLTASSDYRISQTIENDVNNIGAVFISKSSAQKSPTQRIKNEDIPAFYDAYLKDLKNRDGIDTRSSEESAYEIDVLFEKDENKISRAYKLISVSHTPFPEENNISKYNLGRETSALNRNTFTLTKRDVNTIEFLLSKGYLKYFEMPETIPEDQYYKLKYLYCKFEQ